MSIEFPITVAAFLTIAGSALFASLVAQWLKQYLSEWRYTNLIVLLLAVLAAEIAQWLASGPGLTGRAAFEAGLLGFFGASLATFGFETIANLLGKMGYGKRSDTAIMAQRGALIRLGERAGKARADLPPRG